MIEANQKILARYLKDTEVATMTSKAVQSLRNERYKRIGIPFIRMGGAIRYDIQDVIRYMDERRILTDQ